MEVWLCPDGGTAWHVHPKHGQEFNALAGGDPVLGRKGKSGRAYSFIASEHMYWALSNLKSVLEHFTEDPIFLGTDTDFEERLPRTRSKGALCRKDVIALNERDRIRALLDERRPLDHLIQMDLFFDVRFLAKIAIAFGFKNLGNDYDKLRYTGMLRNILRTRRANLDPAEHQVSMKNYFVGLQDYTFRHISFPLGFVFLLKAFREGLILGIVFPSGHYVQALITDSTIDPHSEKLVKTVKDHAMVSIPQLKKTFGPIDFAYYVSWKLGSHRINELDDILARFTDRAKMPSLR